MLHLIAQLAKGEAVRGKAVNRAVSVPELVIKEGADNALGQGLAHIADLFADLVPGVIDHPSMRAAEEIDKDHRPAGIGVAAQDVEVWHLLQRALEPLGQLQQGLVERGAGPLRLHHHRADREYRVFRPPELEKGERPGGDDDDHQIDDYRAVADRPLGKIETAHDAAPSSLTFSPGRSDCTPAVTMTSP